MVEDEGLTNHSTNINEYSLPAATAAFVFIVVPMKGVWKIPIAYFLTDHGLDANEKANLVLETLNILTAVAVVWDVPATSFAIGASLSVEIMQPYFPHPSIMDSKVYMVFDPCHKVKLMRTALADRVIFTDRDGR
jgi:hypothetical protein